MSFSSALWLTWVAVSLSAADGRPMLMYSLTELLSKMFYYITALIVFRIITVIDTFFRLRRYVFSANRRSSNHLIDAPNGRIDQMTPGHLIDAPNGRVDQMKTGKQKLRPTACGTATKKIASRFFLWLLFFSSRGRRTRVANPKTKLKKN